MNFPPKHVYQFNSSSQSPQSLADEISNDLDIDTSTILYSFIGDSTEDFLKNYTLDSNLHPVIIEDFVNSMISNYTYFDNVFCESFYFLDLDNSNNQALKKQIETYKGIPSVILNKYSVLIYIALQMMKTAITLTKTTEADDLRYRLYITEFDTPLGPMKVFSNNYVSQYNVLRKISKDGEFKSEFTYPRPICPMPYHPIDNDRIYYDISFALNEDHTKHLKEIIGIVYYSNIQDRTNSFINYDVSKIVIEETNYNGGIKGYEIITELYQCPKDDTYAASEILKLKNRGIYIIIGGCDTQHRDDMKSIVESMNMVFFYTGFNAGGDCSRNMYIYYLYIYVVFIYMIRLLKLLFHLLCISFIKKMKVLILYIHLILIIVQE